MKEITKSILGDSKPLDNINPELIRVMYDICIFENLAMMDASKEYIVVGGNPQDGFIVKRNESYDNFNYLSAKYEASKKEFLKYCMTGKL